MNLIQSQLIVFVRTLTLGVLSVVLGRTLGQVRNRALEARRKSGLTAIDKDLDRSRGAATGHRSRDLLHGIDQSAIWQSGVNPCTASSPKAITTTNIDDRINRLG